MDIYDEISLFFKEPLVSVREKCGQAGARVNRLWDAAGPHDEQGITDWYRKTDAHIYEGANWHSANLEARRMIAREAKGDILCFGAGIGTEGICAAEMGKNVTFYDLQSVIFEFLKFRVHLRGLPNVKFIDQELVKTKTGNKIFYRGDSFNTYDTIICIDVLEHLNYPQEVLNFLGRHLRSGGIFMISSPFDRVEYRGHLPQNKDLDIDLMMFTAGIRDYRKEILSNFIDNAGVRVSWDKFIALRAVYFLPVPLRFKHKMLYGLTKFKNRLLYGRKRG